MSLFKTLIIAVGGIIGFGLAAISFAPAQSPAGADRNTEISSQTVKNFQDGWKSHLKNFQDNWKSNMKAPAEAEYIQAMNDFQDHWVNSYMKNFQDEWKSNITAKDFQDRWANYLKDFQDNWKSNVKDPSEPQRQAMRDFQDQWKSYLKNFQDNWKSNVRG
jgi:hypothetical protein